MISFQRTIHCSLRDILENHFKSDYLILILTHKCNRGCRYCPVEKQNKSMNRITALRAVNLFITSPGNKKTIKFFGGEPLLEFFLIKQIVLHARRKARDLQKNINFILPTNGTLLNTKTFDFIQKENIYLILNSTYLNENIKFLSQQSMDLSRIMVNFFILPAFVSHAYANFVKFTKFGFRRFNFLPADYTKWGEVNLHALECEFKKITSFLLTANEQFYIHNSNSMIRKVPLFNNRLTIDCNGDIFSSDIILLKGFEKFREEIKNGNVNNINYKRIKKEINLKNLLKEIIAEEALVSTHKVDKILLKFFAQIKFQHSAKDV